MPTSYLLPNHIKYWINAIPKPSCALLNTLEDLSSNNTLIDLTTYAVNGQTIPHIEKSSSYHSVVRCILSYLHETYGGNNLPAILRHSTTSDMIARGQPEETLCLLEILFRISRNQPITSPSPSPDSNFKKTKGEKKKKDKLLEFVMMDQQSHKETQPQVVVAERSPIEQQQSQRSPQRERKRQQQPQPQPQEPRLEQQSQGKGQERHSSSTGRHIKFGANQTKFIPTKEEEQNLDSETDIARLTPSSDQHNKTHRLGDRKGHQRQFQREGSRHELSEESNNPYGPSLSQRDQLPRNQLTDRPLHLSTHSRHLSHDEEDEEHEEEEEEEDIFTRPRVGSNDIDLVFGDLPINQPLDHSISSEQRMKILRWLSTLGLCPRPPAFDPCTGPPASPAPTSAAAPAAPVDLEDDWINGVFLSELAALCSHGNRNEVKQVTARPLVKIRHSSPRQFQQLQQQQFSHKSCFVKGDNSNSNGNGNLLNKPQLMLVGTENIVKSRAQAMRNMQIALKSLSCHSGLEDLEFILPQDLVLGRRSLWPVLNEIYRLSPSLIIQWSRSTSPSTAAASRSRSLTRQGRGQSRSPSRDRAAAGGEGAREEQETGRGRGVSTSPERERGRGRKSPERNGKTVVLSKSLKSKINRTSATTVVDAKAVRRSPSPPVTKRTSSPLKRSSSTSVPHTAATAVSEAAGTRARRSIRSASPPKHRPSSATPSSPSPSAASASHSSMSHPLKVHLKRSKTKPLSLKKATSASASASAADPQRQLGSGWDASWNQHDRDTIWDLDPDSKFQSSSTSSSLRRETGESNRAHSAPRLREGHQRQKNQRQMIRREPSWYPPSLLSSFSGASASGAGGGAGAGGGGGGVSEDHKFVTNELELLSFITPQQQHVIKNWLYSLGISLPHTPTPHTATPHTAPHTATAPLVSLKDDTLRNGELLCDLLCVLEPNASKHAQLSHLIYRKPISLSHVLSNLERALWLLRIRKCPPIPLVYLTHPQLLMEGHRNMTWGLLHQLMIYYPLPVPMSLTLPTQPLVHTQQPTPHSTGGGAGGKTSMNTGAAGILITSRPPLGATAAGAGAGASASASHCYLPYSLLDRKLLDQSLVLWLINEGILSGLMTGLTPPPPLLSSTSTSTSPLLPSLPSITTLEGPLRDGTLLCLLVNKILPNYPTPVIKGINKQPKTYASCIRNLSLAINALKLFKPKPGAASGAASERAAVGMSSRFLFSGVEHEIAKGEWSVILGLLEDLHKLRDGISPTHSSSGSVQKPYLGEGSYDLWPPPLENKVFTVVGEGEREGQGQGGREREVDLKRNVPIHQLLYPPPVAAQGGVRQRRGQGQKGGRSHSPPPPPPPSYLPQDEEEGEEEESGAETETKIDIFPSSGKGKGEGKMNPVRGMRLQYLSNNAQQRSQLQPQQQSRRTERGRGRGREEEQEQEQEEEEEEEEEREDEQEREQGEEYREPFWDTYRPTNDITPDSWGVSGGIARGDHSQYDLFPSSQSVSSTSAARSSVFSSRGQPQRQQQRQTEDWQEDKEEDEEEERSDVAIRGSDSGSSSFSLSQRQRQQQQQQQQQEEQQRERDSYRGPPKPSQLRVQAITSRQYPRPPPPPSLPNPSPGDSRERTPSPLKLMREEYEKENRRNAQREAQPEGEGSWDRMAKALYRGRGDTEDRGEAEEEGPPDWVHDLQQQQQQQQQGQGRGQGRGQGQQLRNSVYDENLSVSSTPPQQRPRGSSSSPNRSRSPSRSGSGSGSLSRVSGLLDSSRLKSATIVFRWLAKLGLVTPSTPPLHILHPSSSSSSTSSPSSAIPISVSMSLEQAPLLLPSFQDGVLFGKLIQKLERKGNELSFLFKGFTEYPKNRAQKLQNIRKVLSFLVREKKIPESAGGVPVEEEILEGNSVVIIDLLLKIRDVYRLKTRYAQ